MRVYLQPPQPSRGLDRIAHALAKYAPSTVIPVGFQRHTNKFTTTQNDMVVIYAIGRRDHIQRQVEEVLSLGKQYAIIQVCLRSTMSPLTKDWFDIWRQAKVVWSYYDLDEAINADSEPLDGFDDYYHLPNFLHTPLGVDSSIFYPRATVKDFVIATSGRNRLQESIRECLLAAAEVDKVVFHLGRLAPHWGSNLICNEDISDDMLAARYSHCEFVSGLRRTEGFELPAAEGLLCGSRPVVFDTPDYRWNYREFAEYIHEGTRAEVVDQLVQLFKQGARPVGQAELHEARHWFNWERVCGEFWQRCLQ